jgi:translation initiation factor 2 subunit 2
MNRNQEHVFQFILAELGTTGSIDGSQRMVIRGRFPPKAIENIIRKYAGWSIIVFKLSIGFFGNTI